MTPRLKQAAAPVTVRERDAPRHTDSRLDDQLMGYSEG